MIHSCKKPPVYFPTVTGDICSFNSQYAGLPLKSHVVEVVATQSGSGTPSPDNVRPISGYSAINIGSDAKYAGFINFNQLYKITAGNTTLLGVTRSISNGLITFSGETTGVGNSVLFAWTDFTIPNGHKVIVLKDFTLPEGDYIFDQYNGFANKDITNTIMNISAGYSIPQLKVSGVGHDYTGISGHLSVIDLTVMFGTTKADEIYQMEQQTAGSGVAYFRSLFPNDYYDYNAGTLTTVSAVNGVSNSMFTIQIGSTVYGGTFDAITGILTVTHGFETYDGSVDETWDAFNIDLRMGVRGRTTANKSYVDSNISNIFYNSTSNETYAEEANLYTWRSSPYVSNLVFFYVPLSENITSVEQWRTWLSNHPTTICYELATPTTIQLPPCPIDTLEGVNNIWADTGDTTLQYPKFG